MRSRSAWACLGLSLAFSGCAFGPPKNYEKCIVQTIVRNTGVGLPRYRTTCANADGTTSEVNFPEPLPPGTTHYFVPYTVEGEDGVFGSLKGG